MRIFALVIASEHFSSRTNIFEVRFAGGQLTLSSRADTSGNQNGGEHQQNHKYDGERSTGPPNTRKHYFESPIPIRRPILVARKSKLKVLRQTSTPGAHS